MPIHPHPIRAHTVLTAILFAASAMGPARPFVPGGKPLNEPFAAHIQVDAAQSQGKLKPIWRFFGADEPNYATMKKGRKLMKELGGLGSDQIYFRTHNLLTTGDGTPALKWGSTNAYTDDTQGNPKYDWTILDRIFDSYRKSGVRPYVQVGFMPEALSIKPQPYQHKWTPTAKYEEIYTGWAYPPKDYAKWGELAYQWAKHCVERYGRAEVETWYWEVWNEANIGYWRGTPQEFHKLHDYAVAGIRRALPAARVGGPDTAGGGGRFTEQFLDHCLHGTNYATGAKCTPLDFVSFHAKGAPTFLDGHVRMGISNHLRTIDEAFAKIAANPEIRDKPIVIGESDPDGCAACQGPQLSYRNGLLYASYTAAAFARKHDLAAKHGVNLEGALTWAFEFEDQPYFAGFRVLASNGIDLPVLNVFRMFGKMGGDRISAVSDHQVAMDQILRSGVRQYPDVGVLASRNKNRVAILVWHYHDDDVPGADASVQLKIAGLPANSTSARVSHFRIDDAHSNAYEVWKRLGSPQSPTPDQVSQLEKAGHLATLARPSSVRVHDGAAMIPFSLPRQAISLVTIEWAEAKP
jgi:xylan 1,4-beta-xylosidase